MEQPQIEKKFRAGAISATVWKNITAKENISLETQQYDFGVFVKSIGGKESSAEPVEKAAIRTVHRPAEVGSA